ncbi:isochorismatase family protein [Hoeflea poritis]|uniref:Isochorismatase family protein n=1 Tax=Hoeflea poritis TaxID=2993659 RepID=A0ABT4VQW5_9HYPH|nr:isochorismatase family protein [Hoeflea poritis]MDA4846999.1 isochorismatase family protein [Hoeflea poritis]
MSEQRVYERQGYGGTVGFGNSPALLIVDFVNGFLDPEQFGGGNIVEAAQKTTQLLAAARKADIPVIFTRVVYAEDGSDIGMFCRKATRLSLLTENAEVGQVTDLLAPQSGELIVRKTQASAFFGTSLAPNLIAKGVDTVLVAGCTTSGCVRASVVDAVSYNFRPIVVADCVGDRALGPHDANLFDMGQKYADLMNCDEAVARF